MATLKEYFEKDLPSLTVHKTVEFIKPDSKVEIIARAHFDFNANAKYFSFYIPPCENPFDVCVALLNNMNVANELIDNVGLTISLLGDEKRESTELQFSGRVFIYSQNPIDSKKWEAFKVELKDKGVFIHLRTQIYAEERSKNEKPLAFISHDSRDKELFANKIAIGLQSMMCPVWYDEYSLNVGDSLRESIEKGIRECKKCVLILSPNFLTNTGWTKAEFNAIFTRELIEKTNFILPVWCGINKKELFDYSPSLADRVGVKFDIGVDEVVKRLYTAITTN